MDEGSPPPVVLLRPVVRERVGGEVVEKRRRAAWKSQRIKTSADMAENLPDDRRLRDEPHDAHSLVALAQERVGLVDEPMGVRVGALVVDEQGKPNGLQTPCKQRSFRGEIGDLRNCC